MIQCVFLVLGVDHHGWFDKTDLLKVFKVTGCGPVDLVIANVDWK